MQTGLNEAIDELLELDPSTLSDTELHDIVVGGTRSRSRLDGALASFTAEWDTRRIWADDGSRAPWARLARECGLSPVKAKANLCRARRLRSMHCTRDALTDGRLSTDQTELVVKANQPGLEDYFERDETLLVEQVSTLRYQDAQRAVRYWTETAHDHAGTRQRDPGFDRHVTTARTFHGTVDIRGLLDPIGGTAFVQELERLEQLLYQHDAINVNQRTHQQRRGDALVE